VLQRRWSLDPVFRHLEKLALVLQLLGSLAPVKLSRVLGSWVHIVALIFRRLVPGALPSSRLLLGASRARAGFTRHEAVTPMLPSSSSSWLAAGAWRTRLRDRAPGVSASSLPMMHVKM
jgi:hypothetical protein